MRILECPIFHTNENEADEDIRVSIASPHSQDISHIRIILSTASLVIQNIVNKMFTSNNYNFSLDLKNIMRINGGFGILTNNKRNVISIKNQGRANALQVTCTTKVILYGKQCSVNKCFNF